MIAHVYVVVRNSQIVGEDLIINAPDLVAACNRAAALEHALHAELRRVGVIRDGRYYFDVPLTELPAHLLDRAEETALFEAGRRRRKKAA